ncbi:hypothetical protein Tsubulata_015330 [Turnera subulata]|uniref:non-specific serine/threonine protein kinase n=1 Tax=Turnera subulata TaxID=218843 RepID=A0A9Q0FTU5_9ROSI|nr:hypothetical protein Tsubulata_015330 [Turnera subulata]
MTSANGTEAPTRLEDYHPSRVLTLVYQPFAVGTMAILAHYEAKIDTRKRNILGYILFAATASGKGGPGPFVGVCAFVAAFGVADAHVQGGMVGDLAFMCPEFMQSFFAGLAASGALTSALRLITKAAFDKANDGLRKGAIKYYRAKAASEGSKTVSADLAAAGIHKPVNEEEEDKTVERLSNKELLLQNVDYALDLYLIYVLTLSIFPGFLYENTGQHGLGAWYALVLIAMYNVWDLIGRYVPLISCISCLNGFEPQNAEEWSKGNWTSGCIRSRLLRCNRSENGSEGEKEDGFLKLDTECRNECLSDCSCVAYAYYPGFGCILWRGNLDDMQKFSSGGSDLYIRLTYSELGIKEWKVKIGKISVLIEEERPIISDWKMNVEKIRRENLQELPLFSLDTLATATKNFHESNKLGQGGFGPVYKGTMPDGEPIAVKRLSRASRQGLEEFMNEVSVISKLQHRNLVRLLGCCVEGEENIGYMSPEYAIKGQFSEKSDVFSFGVLLLEIVSGRRNTSFHDNAQALSLLEFAWKLWNEGKVEDLVDPVIFYPCFQEEIHRCIHVGLLCVQEYAEDRPAVPIIISMLNSEIMELPAPKQVAFVERKYQTDADYFHQSKQRYSLNDVTLTDASVVAAEKENEIPTRLQKYHPSRVVTLIYQPFAFGTITILACNESKLNTRLRNIAGYILYTASTLMLLMVDVITSGKAGIGYFVGVCACVACFGLADALVQGGMVGDLSLMCPEFNQAASEGSKTVLADLAAAGIQTSQNLTMRGTLLEDMCPSWYADQGWMITLTSFLGITNGYLTVCILMVAPRGYKGPEQNALGNLLVLFLLGGIFSGVCLDWLWIIGKGSF